VPLEVDHVFVTCAAGAPEGNALLALGFVEGSGNTHPGQGTANRRFFFENFMLELVWVSDQEEARSERTQRTRLWERWAQREQGVCPFGIVFRSAGGRPSPAPFPMWSYAPSYLPPGMSIEIAEGTTLSEPELFYISFLKRAASRGRQPIVHAIPITKVCGIAVGIPDFGHLSAASRIAAEHGLLRYFESPQFVLEILFEGAPELRFDLRPALPLLFRAMG
jgi:Glyoxalase-like domain